MFSNQMSQVQKRSAIYTPGALVEYIEHGFLVLNSFTILIMLAIASININQCCGTKRGIVNSRLKRKLRSIRQRTDEPEVVLFRSIGLFLLSIVPYGQEKATSRAYILYNFVCVTTRCIRRPKDACILRMTSLHCSLNI